MQDYTTMPLDQIQEELKRAEALLEDAQDERSFMGKQTSMHINTSEFKRLDQDIERYGERVEVLRAQLAARSN